MLSVSLNKTLTSFHVSEDKSRLGHQSYTMCYFCLENISSLEKQDKTKYCYVPVSHVCSLIQFSWSICKTILVNIQSLRCDGSKNHFLYMESRILNLMSKTVVCIDLYKNKNN